MRHRITFAHPTPNLLTCVGSFARTESDPSRSGIRQLARGNSHTLQPGKFQLDRSKKFPTRTIKLNNKLPREAAVTSVPQTLKIHLDDVPRKGTQAGPALSRRWEQVTFGVPSDKNRSISLKITCLWYDA